MDETNTPPARNEHVPRRLSFHRVAHTPGFRVRFDCSCGLASNLTTHGADTDEAKARAEAICASHAEPRTKCGTD